MSGGKNTGAILVDWLRALRARGGAEYNSRERLFMAEPPWCEGAESLFPLALRLVVSPCDPGRPFKGHGYRSAMNLVPISIVTKCCSADKGSTGW